jgi:uncharacterized protein (TIGR03083 family)
MIAMPPILVADLFPEISRHLLELLRSLGPDEWHLPTSSSQRCVKDVASHLLDGSLRRLSMQRDRYSPPGAKPTKSLLDFLNELNADWDVATRRLSPAVLVGLLEWADPQVADLFKSLDPFDPAIFPVAWTGEQQSQNWMDVAREFTEKWHHTQQIFDATGRPSTIIGRRLFQPCLDTLMRALPFTFRNFTAEPGSTVAVVVSGEAGGTWYIERCQDVWRQVVEPNVAPRSTVMLDQLTAWRLVTKRRSREAALAQFPDIQIEGDLGGHVLEMVSMIA